MLELLRFIKRAQGLGFTLAEVDGLVRQAAARRETPMSVVLSRLDLQRDTERPLLPLCSSQVRTLDLAAGGLSWRGEIVFISDSTLDFLLMVRDDEQGVQLNFTYATELYDEATVARYAEGLLALLMAGYGISMIACLPWVGRGSDRHGRRPYLLLGAGLRITDMIRLGAGALVSGA